MGLAGNLDHLLATYGYAAVFAFPLIESTGIPFPGETMLLTAGVYASLTGHLQIGGVIAAAAAGAIVGDNFGYAVGRLGGRRLVESLGTRLHLPTRTLLLAERFFARHGGKTVFLGRFVAILRTWAALVAGISRMPWRRFLVFNALGGICWATLFGMLAFVAGRGFVTYRPLLERLGLGLAVLGVAMFVLGWFFARRQMEHWLLAEERIEEKSGTERV